MNQSISIAAIGAGAWGRNLVKTLDQLGVLRVVAESAVGLRTPLQAAYPHLEMVDDALALLQRDDIDAVTIATPAPTHHALARAFLLAGKDVFVEKPMTLTSAEAADLVQIAEEIIATLAADPNAEVKVRIEIEASFAHGVKDQTKRAISENAKTLGFNTAEWE